jgi:wyosine [tRNA(Phe)-imidazoG37] synthetase (radical SAM superfamily)
LKFAGAIITLKLTLVYLSGNINLKGIRLDMTAPSQKPEKGSDLQYVFGPVPSRRLGQSLGIDTIPLKTCNWNCVYCQLGRSTPLIGQRSEYIPVTEILSQTRIALAAHSRDEIDWVTFVGSGEPTLHAGIGVLIQEVKKMTDIPVAVITNGSLLYLPTVRKELLEADAVLPSLDAGTPELYKKINRPHPGISYKEFLQGLINFRRETQGEFWLEVMLVRGVNDSEEELKAIADKIKDIQPTQVHISTPTRPPAEKWVKPPDEEAIMRAIAILGDAAVVTTPVSGVFDLNGGENIIEGIIGIITRHPMSEEQLINAIENSQDEVQTEIIHKLKESNRVQIIERFGKKFWCGMPSVYPETDKNTNHHQ